MRSRSFAEITVRHVEISNKARNHICCCLQGRGGGRPLTLGTQQTVRQRRDKERGITEYARAVVGYR
jgi:hypothetical protein